MLLQHIQNTTADTAATDVAAEAAKFTPQVGTITPGATITAAQQQTTSVANVEAAQGTATMVNAPDKRDIQEGEIISGAADATKAAAFTEAIQAAEATPSKQATVAAWSNFDSKSARYSWNSSASAALPLPNSRLFSFNEASRCASSWYCKGSSASLSPSANMTSTKVPIGLAKMKIG